MPESSAMESVSRGRPMRYASRADQPVTFLVTTEQKAALAQMSHEERRPMSEIVRDAVDSYVGDYSEKKLFVLTRRTYRPE